MYKQIIQFQHNKYEMGNGFFSPSVLHSVQIQMSIMEPFEAIMHIHQSGNECKPICMRYECALRLLDENTQAELSPAYEMYSVQRREYKTNWLPLQCK